MSLSGIGLKSTRVVGICVTIATFGFGLFTSRHLIRGRWSSSLSCNVFGNSYFWSCIDQSWFTIWYSLSTVLLSSSIKTKIVDIISAPYFGVPLSVVNWPAGTSCLIVAANFSGSSPLNCFSLWKPFLCRKIYCFYSWSCHWSVYRKCNICQTWTSKPDILFPKLIVPASAMLQTTLQTPLWLASELQDVWQECDHSGLSICG